MAIHRLYGELAASLVRAITDCWAPSAVPARAGAKLDDMCQTAFECARSTLARLGLATDEYKLAIDADRVAQFVMDRSRAGQITLPPIDDVLTAWILLCGSQLGLASLRRLPFTPHDDIRPVMDALAALGYAKPLGNAFIWMDKIGPAMQMSGYWDENNLSREELEQRDVDLDMRNALASIPEDVKHAALTDNRTAVVKALAARWVDGAWLPDSVDGDPWWRWAALAPEAKRLMELVQGADGPLTRDVN
ncbi:hypothetical protein [Bradyrhizobium valentinum]|uniref:Uncharacterized protein n=1 Tax=Bradyrhizobium valentinum TaxID=1518501 RepID=A0A0R3KZG6_9BRAD|nr:hypothetical protein [Bradyrhizobium valentinum]KRR00778.1 hypothetical protein CQ10_03165 [Bradyrhizobium valentinum]KRR00879.1 hypothetical protein CP49_31105 [Bradyrhizobium valentinum]